MRCALLLAAPAVLLAPGCFLPLATGTPEPATTVGTGKFGVGVTAEAPTLDLTEGADDFSDTYAAAPAAAGKLGVAYGVAEHTDVEASLETSLYLYFLPLPIGGSIGVRQELVTGARVDVAITGRIGAVRVGGEDAEGREDSASAELAQVGLAVQGVFGGFRPLLSLSGMGARITRNVDGVAQDLQGGSGAVTVGAMFQLGNVQLGPYATATYFDSDASRGRAMVSGGLSLQLRPDRHTR
jgi:hypothetical protein